MIADTDTRAAIELLQGELEVIRARAPQGLAFVQGGNSFGTKGLLSTNDGFGLVISAQGSPGNIAVTPVAGTGAQFGLGSNFTITAPANSTISATTGSLNLNGQSAVNIVGVAGSAGIDSTTSVVNVGTSTATGVNIGQGSSINVVLGNGALAGFTQTAALYVKNTVAGNTNGALGLQAGSDAGTGALIVDIRRPDGTQIGNITQNAAGTVAFNTSSDERMKESIEDSPLGLDDVMKLRVRRFKNIGCEVVQDGFIAQELLKTYPFAVSGSENDDTHKELVHDEATGHVTAIRDTGVLAHPLSIDRSLLIPMLVKAVQELSLKIAALEASAR